VQQLIGTVLLVAIVLIEKAASVFANRAQELRAQREEYLHEPEQDPLVAADFQEVESWR
jgi:hypothetical protein